MSPVGNSRDPHHQSHGSRQKSHLVRLHGGQQGKPTQPQTTFSVVFTFKMMTHGLNNYKDTKILNVVLTGPFNRVYRLEIPVSHAGIFDRLCEALPL